MHLVMFSAMGNNWLQYENNVSASCNNEWEIKVL